MKLQMANQFLQMGRFGQAEALYKQILATEPDNVDATLSLGVLYSQQDNYDQAVRFFRKTLALEPENWKAQLKLAMLFENNGQLEQASSCHRRVLELQPRCIGSLLFLARLKKHAEYTDEIRLMEEMYGDPDLPENYRRALAITLGKVFDELKEYDKAFSYWEAGNRIAWQKLPEHSIEAEERRSQSIREYFDSDFFQRYSDAGITDDSLIIVTGMPRSGTSLVEQILASHPNVCGVGEAPNLHNIVLELEEILGSKYPANFNMLDKRLLGEMANRYVTELKELAGNEYFVTDKNLSSPFYMGLINVMLPGAKIIHCNRDPRDQGLSLFQKDFGGQHLFGYDLKEIGRFYNIYQGVMSHWNRMLEGRIYQVQYESVVDDFEHSVRGLLDYCGLPFDDACLSFYETERVVRTASYLQVRQPLYASSVGRWRHYERQLQPLISELKTQSEC